MVLTAEPILCPKCLHHLPLARALSCPSLSHGTRVRTAPSKCRSCLLLRRASLPALGSFARGGLEGLQQAGASRTHITALCACTDADRQASTPYT